MEEKMSEYNDNNVFAKIINGSLSCDKVYEDEVALAFHDIYPAASIHVLVIPKGRYISFDDFMEKAEGELVIQFFKTVRKIAHNLGLQESGYRIITNHGDNAQQTIHHFHVHILGHQELGPLIDAEYKRSNDVANHG
jgi:histidine triad (HIT) family protein